MTCKSNNWSYIVTFKEGNLPTIWEETRELQVYQTENHHHEMIMRPVGAPSYLMKYLGLLSPNIHSHTERIG